MNLIDADTIEQLARLVTRIEEAPSVAVVVFDSANPDYFMAHWDLRADGRGWPRWHPVRRDCTRTSTTWSGSARCLR